MVDQGALKDFSLREYDSLRSEITEGVKECAALEKYTVTACAAFWSWVLAQSTLPVLDFLKWIPLIFCALTGIRSLALFRSIMRLCAYLELVQKEWGSENAFRWELYVKPYRLGLALPGFAVWFSILMGNAFIAAKIHSGWLKIASSA